MTQSLTGVKLRTKIPVFYISDKINLNHQDRVGGEAQAANPKRPPASKVIIN